MTQYYYLDANSQQCGPVPQSSLLQVGITQDTMVWTNGMPGWAKAGNVMELQALFAPPQPPREETIVPPQAPTYNEPTTPVYELCPSSNLVWAILTTLFCCLPFGIVAIVHAAKVEGLWNAGQKELARAKASEAKKWCWISAGVGLAWGFLYFIYILIVGIAAAGF